MNSPVSVEAQPFWGRLAEHGSRVALVCGNERVSYADLADRVAVMAGLLGPTRRLVVLESANTVDTVVAYLAALAGGHPVILTPDAESVASYDADLVISGGRVVERQEGAAHDLHPDLALLLSTSGSTGSPKLVRLSHKNLHANATAIASYLHIRPTDVAPTTLPLHYCYGLSVLNSHLSVGAAVLLTEASLVDEGFWQEFRAAGCTTLAGVPFTFELLDRVGFADLDLPTLRYVTQAGGRLDPAAVRRYAELGLQRGFDLFVMYGQTEATARMAYLPPEMVLSCPDAVGVPVPGGSFRIDDGELVYSGDNVMLGYAEKPADLARGRDLHELRTGDLGRQRPDGLFEVTGRKSRFAKVFGLRIDLQRIEQTLAAEHVVVHCADAGDHVVVAIDISASPAPADLAGRAAAAAGLPESSVRVLRLPRIPRLPSGKPDYRSIVGTSGSPRDRGEPDADLTALYARILRRDTVTPDDSFVSLNGDSLSYVELSIRLEQALGHLPVDWHSTPLRELATQVRKPRRGRSVETNVVLRALAIVMIVGTHAGLFTLVGGAHVLLGVAGFNFGRFFLTATERLGRVRHVLGAAARIVVPSVLWLGLVWTFGDTVTWRNVALVNGLFGPEQWDDASWHYWFIEAIVATLLGLAVLVSLPAFDRAERRWPFWMPMSLALVALLTRYDVVALRPGDEIHRAHVTFWIFALGWAAAKATRHRERLLVSVVTVACMPGFFQTTDRTLMVTSGLLLLVWVRSVRIPAILVAPVGVLAAASLFIYLCHWQVYPSLEDAGHSVLATVLSLSGGVGLWWVASGEIRDNLRWFNLRRYATSDPRTRLRGAARPRRDDQPAHIAA